MSDKPPSVPLSLEGKKEEEGEESEESEFQGENFELDNTSISGQLAYFLRTSGFDDKLFTFLHTEADKLEICPPGEEQKLEVYDAYQRFTQLFDGEFSDFMARIGCSNLDEMYERLSAEDKADHRASRFFEGLLAGMEYSSFVTLVRNFQEADDDEDDDSSQDLDDENDSDGDNDADQDTEAKQSLDSES